MTGIEGFNFPAFNAMAARLRANGLSVVNPVDLNPDPRTPRIECLRSDIRELCGCDGIALMPGWQQSSGASLELHVAQHLGFEVRTAHQLLTETEACQ